MTDPDTWDEDSMPWEDPALGAQVVALRHVNRQREHGKVRRKVGRAAPAVAETRTPARRERGGR